MIDYTENLDLACEKFRKILEAQLKRVEDMKSQHRRMRRRRHRSHHHKGSCKSS